MKDISVKALAKINLGLDVVRKREDGYHEVRMVMQTIHLFDRLEISKNTSGEITMETNLSFLPTNENNLVYKAAKLLQDEFAIWRACMAAQIHSGSSRNGRGKHGRSGSVIWYEPDF